MYFVYILYSNKCDRYYIGYTENIDQRLERHNRGQVKATKNCRPYILKAYKAFSTEWEAMKEERRIKNQKSRIIIEQMIRGNW